MSFVVFLVEFHYQGQMEIGYVSWRVVETLKLDLGWRWKYALSDCMDIDDASVSSRDYSRFLEFALCLQSVELVSQ